MKHLGRALKYIDLIIAVVIAFVIIKIIDNCGAIISVLGFFYNILSPFVYALIIAYILNPIMCLFEKRFKLKRSLSLLITYVIILATVSIIGIYLIPMIYENILEMTKNIPYITDTIQGWYNDLMNNDSIKSLVTSKPIMDNFDPATIISKTNAFLTSFLNLLVSKIFVFTNSFIKWIFGFIISIYILADKENFKLVGKRIVYLIFRNKYGSIILEFLSNIDNMIGVYIGIKAIDSVIVACIAFIGLTVIKSPYAVVLALVVGITNMIPYFGPFLGILVSGIVNLFVSPIKAIVVIMFLFLLQQFDAWVLDPKLIGGRVGLSPFLIILAVTIGGGIYGAVGMILSVPIMAVIKIYIDRWIGKGNLDKL